MNNPFKSKKEPVRAAETPEEERKIEAEFDALLNDYLNSSHRKKTEIIRKAYHFAKKAHSGVRRRSGEPYIMHPIAVARIVAGEIGLGSTSICAALLHDVVEDTEYTTEDIATLFGERIAIIVDGLTKISGGVFGDKASAQAENFRKLLITMSEDIRVILIKIADRLHNMRTLSSMPPRKQYKIAGETQYIYAPLAHRLGLFAIKTELENLSFLYEHPETYHEIERKLEATKDERDLQYKEFANPIVERLKELPFHCDVTARVKSIYSIWNKMQKKGVGFNEIYDILALRIVFDMDSENATIDEERRRCWQIHSAITSVYKPHPSRLRDWISQPKANGYEALHVTVMGPQGYWIEVQIRSRRMDDIAERGFAAHWKYKHENTDVAKISEIEEDSELDKWLKTIQELLENPDSSAMDFLDTFKLSLFASEIFVFTPKGDMKTLPKGATVLDFAFSLHTDLGMRCIGAKVNHKLVALNHELDSGDQVEVLTSQKQRPQPEWIHYVTTARARMKIKSLFKYEYNAFIKKGEKELREVLGESGIEMNEAHIEQMVEQLGTGSRDELLYRIGKGTLGADEVRKVFKKESQNRFVNYWKLRLPGGKKQPTEPTESGDKNALKITDDEAGRTFRIATCCNPIPGDEVIGFKSADGTVLVHKHDCAVALRQKATFGQNIVTAEWATHRVLSFPVVLAVKGFDKVGVLMQILRIITEEYAVNMQEIHLKTEEGIFKGTIKLYVYDTEDVNNLCMHISKIREVESVKRVEVEDTDEERSF